MAEGRSKPVDYIDSIAQGRIWSGTAAVRLGLADRIGNLHDAIGSAAAKAGITDYRLKEFPGEPDIFELIFGGQKEEVKETAIKKELGVDLYKAYSTVRYLKEGFGRAQARLPFEVIIQ